MDLFSSLAPDGVSLAAALALVVLSFFTSALTGAFGLGGGLALLAAMSALLPPLAVVPVHGAAQLGSNASRLAFLRRYITWPIVLWFSGGALIGALLGGRIAVALPAEGLRVAIAGFILVTLWAPKPKAFAAGKVTFVSGGAATSFVSMFVGASGPLVASLLAATKLDRLNIVATHATCLVVQHGLKTLVFGALGFAYHQWALLIVMILAAGAGGSYAGTRLLRKLPERVFQRAFKTILTLIALYLAGAAFF